ncbi:MAG: hypothetical protein M5U25_00880 [Planctomycetota bacterium]|nr:hypothetical protein [Planctomycetota bacterium]
MRTLTPLAVFALLLAACASTPKPAEPPSPLASIDRFYAAPVVYDFDEPADWELPPGEWDEKTGDFSEAFVHRLEVTRRAPISRLEGDLLPGGAAIQLIVREVDLGFFAGIVRKPAICKGELLILDAAGEVLISWDVEFRTPGDAGYQWYTYGGRLESAHDAFAVDAISLIQRERGR